MTNKLTNKVLLTLIGVFTGIFATLAFFGVNSLLSHRTPLIPISMAIMSTIIVVAIGTMIIVARITQRNET